MKLLMISEYQIQIGRLIFERKIIRAGNIDLWIDSKSENLCMPFAILSI